MSEANVVFTYTVNADQAVDALTRMMLATWRRWPHSIPSELRDEFDRLEADDVNVQHERETTTGANARESVSHA